MNSRSSRRHRTIRTVHVLLLCFPLNLGGFTFSFPLHTRNSQQKARFHTHMSANDHVEAATMLTAVCIVPPDEAWDTIQRARHMTRDRTYHKWPPCVRLFHPFCPRAELSDKALEIARVVEAYTIEPFHITLSSIAIVPHMEAIEADWEAMKQLPAQDRMADKKKVTEADRLIAEEERLGRERLRSRAKRTRKKRQAAGKPVTETSSEIAAREEEEKARNQSSQDLLEKQKQQYEEFNGPCVLCLEPDEESRERLTQLRELLRSELFEAYSKFSPSSSVSTSSNLPQAILESEETNFRPIVPVGDFPTVTSAVEMARKLKALWDPLSFNVTDFHLISYKDGGPDEFSDRAEYNLKQTASWRRVDIEEETLTTQGQYGCDALVMLIGEEIDTDEESSKEMVDFIVSQGSPGGYELMGKKELIDEVPKLLIEPETNDENSNDTTEELELWLDCDDEYDEGTVIVIGRTHFFTGDMRTYNGMPATNTMDGKDRILEGPHGSVRRKGSGYVHL